MTKEEKKQKVEELGIVFEKLGRTPMASRVLAHLLLAEPPQQSFDMIKESLSASKSAISVALNSLQQESCVKYITFSGDRKRYFLVDGNGWLENTITITNNLTKLNHLLEDIKEVRKDSKYKEFNNEIKQVLDFQRYITEQIDKNIKNWKSK